MALQTFTAGQVLTAAQVTALQTNGFNQSVSTKTADHTLVAADKGTRVEMNSASATTITVNTDLFNAGDTLFIQNRGAGVCTITAGTATVSTSGSLALAEFQGGTLYFVSAGVAIFFLTGSAGGGVAALSDADISGTTGSPTTGTYTDGGIEFKFFSFTGSGSITTTKAGLLNILMVAGGGGGGTEIGGGGGAGGHLVLTDSFLVEGATTITLGAGGSATNRGSDTVVLPFVAVGGGQGCNSNKDGSNGGSGGGSSNVATKIGGKVTGQGNDGGIGSGSSGNSGGGGGGAGAAGANSVNPAGGAGGAGLANSITGSSVTRAGGGGGCRSGAGTVAVGGTGGGGNGGTTTGSTLPTAGGANLGGGGGGALVGAAGGSGIVIVRVLA